MPPRKPVRKPRTSPGRAPARKQPRKSPARKPARKEAPRRRETPRAAVQDAESLGVARAAANAALDKKAENVVILDVRGLSSYADYFVVASGTSDRQVAAIADNVDELLRKAGHRPLGVEGYTRGHWILLDFGDVVAHVFYEDARQFYDIEGLWADARRVPLS
jgi:ribosome-associated protein